MLSAYIIQKRYIFFYKKKRLLLNFTYICAMCNNM